MLPSLRGGCERPQDGTSLRHTDANPLLSLVAVEPAMGRKAKQAREATERTLRAAGLSPEERSFLQANAAYEGSPFHKKNPNDFGLTPPTYPVRPEKTLCDEAGITQKKIALKLFERALQVGLVSECWTAGFPKQMWVVDDGEQVFELMYGGSRPGRYHGYPIRLRDPWSEEIKRVWRERRHVEP